MADFRRQLEVNLIGQVAVTQAFLPLIRRGEGRIVNVGSIGGHLVLPLHGAYSASKFGMEAVSDALRLELRQWRIPVSLIDPGATETAIFGKTLAEIDEVEKTPDEAGHPEYDGQLAGDPAPGREDRRGCRPGRRPREDALLRRSRRRSRSPATWPATARRRRWSSPARQPTAIKDRAVVTRRTCRRRPRATRCSGVPRRRGRSESRRCRPSCPGSCPAAPPPCSAGSRSRGRGMSRPSGS